MLESGLVHARIFLRCAQCAAVASSRYSSLFGYALRCPVGIVCWVGVRPYRVSHRPIIQSCSLLQEYCTETDLYRGRQVPEEAMGSLWTTLYLISPIFFRLKGIGPSRASAPCAELTLVD